MRNSFLVLDAEEVLKIKPGMNMLTDVMAWALEKNGTYSFRSAYRMLKDEQAARAMAATGEAHYYNNFNRGEHFRSTEAGIRNTSDRKSRLIISFPSHFDCPSRLIK